MARVVRRGYTLIELLVVVSIILILASLGLFVMRPIWSLTDRVECSNNLKQIGMILVQYATQHRKFPDGGMHPGAWGQGGHVQSVLTSRMGMSDMMICPAAEPGASTYPAWSACSYAYLGSLTPTYECKCGECKSGDEGREIWTMQWSGVKYSSGHDRSSVYNEWDFSSFDLADNLVFDEDEADDDEPDDPTVPEHLDSEKDRSRRALRQVPHTPQDKSAVPIVVDIVVLTKKPSGSWRDAHTRITEENRHSYPFYANHCSGSADGKGGWGANILFANGSVQWKDWSELRFQLRAPNVQGSTDHFYFF